MRLQLCQVCSALVRAVLRAASVCHVGGTDYANEPIAEHFRNCSW